MQDDTNGPATAPAPLTEKPGLAVGWRVALLLGLGGVVAGLALGILLTTSVFVTYAFLTPTIPATSDSLQVFNELNELRQQVNQLNEENKLKDRDKEEAIRQALSAVGSAARGSGTGMAGVELADK